MPIPDATISEDERLARVASLLPDTLEDDFELKAIADYAAQLAGTPIALVTLVEASRQRFLARQGLEARETPRSQSFCQYAMVHDGVMEVRDAAADPRFADNPLVLGDPNIGFYAGAPLVGDDGMPFGALCVISSEPRPEGLTDFQRDGLQILAQAAIRRMKERRASRAYEESERRLSALVEAMPQMAWSTTPDGMTDYFNRRWEEFTGVPAEQHHGDGWFQALHPDDIEVAGQAWRRAVASGEPYEVEYRLKRHDGQWRWTLARGLPVKDDGGEIERWYGTNTDIHEQKMTAESRDLLARELSHRIKNIFSLIEGLLRLETRADPALRPAVEVVSQRMQALARAHDHVRPDRAGRDGTIRLKALMAELFAPYDAEDGPRVRVEGDDATIFTEAVTPLALLFHELATNAAKYGALSVPEGRVKLSLEIGGETSRLTWCEVDGPGVGAAASAKPGFGDTLLRMAVERQLDGTIERRWSNHGLIATIDVPTRLLTRAKT
ncbi:PAS domain-containing protein [Sphingomonas sp. ASV193]|uniref:PAS domain-containing protein n=1 Tax=Sphingomonas sp. ASV193 TaxID=3144405 RepID=UPI0032E87B85